MSRRRKLSEAEQALWQSVARTIRPLPDRRAPEAPPSEAPPPEPLAPDKPPAASPPTMRAAPPRPAPAPAAADARAASQLDGRRAEKLRRGRLPVEARLDLHGMTVAEAQPALTRFILSARARGLRLVLVITGKGRGGAAPWWEERGVLRRQVPQWLRMPPLRDAVVEVCPAHARHGGEGAYYVYLRRIRPAVRG